MGNTISKGLAAFVLSATFLASQSSAQTGNAIPPGVSSRPAVVSVDILRYPITSKIRHLLLKAMAKMDSGEHETAIQQLRKTLAQYPDSAPYALNLLGVEYVKTDRFAAAVAALEQAASLLPHDAMTHYNLGLALICARDYGRAAQEIRRALELDPMNIQMQARLNALLRQNPSPNLNSAANLQRQAR